MPASFDPEELLAAQETKWQEFVAEAERKARARRERAQAVWAEAQASRKTGI